MALLIVLEPLLGGLVCYLLTNHILRRVALVVFSGGHLALALLLAWTGADDPGSGAIGADAPSLLFLMLTSVLFFPVSWYAAGYLAGLDAREGERRFFSREAVFTGTLLVFLSSMSLALLSRDTGVYWMALEATTLSSAPLIAFRRSASTLEAAWKYLLICSVGIAIGFIGNIALSVSAAFDPAAAGPFGSFQSLTERAASLQGRWLELAFVFLLIGFGTKMGLVPMHTWLPDAHSEAPAPVSALLSGALLNTAFLGIFRYHGILVAAGLGAFSGSLLLFFGIVSMLTAALFIIRQKNYKRLLAYSSIEHMGILAAAVGAGSLLPFAAMYHAVNHSLTKAFLFLVAGNILSIYKTHAAGDIRGMLRERPLLGGLWILGFLAVCGLPPFGTFVSEIAVLRDLALSRRYPALALMLAAASIAAVAMAAVMIPMATGRDADPGRTDRGRPKRGRLLAPLALGLLALLPGLWLPQPLQRLLESAASLAWSWR
jgi:hydrogenase-4 component F